MNLKKIKDDSAAAKQAFKDFWTSTVQPYCKEHVSELQQLNQLLNRAGLKVSEQSLQHPAQVFFNGSLNLEWTFTHSSWTPTIQYEKGWGLEGEREYEIHLQGFDNIRLPELKTLPLQITEEVDGVRKYVNNFFAEDFQSSLLQLLTQIFSKVKEFRHEYHTLSKAQYAAEKEEANSSRIAKIHELYDGQQGFIYIKLTSKYDNPEVSYRGQEWRIGCPRSVRGEEYHNLSLSPIIQSKEDPSYTNSIYNEGWRLVNLARLQFLV